MVLPDLTIDMDGVLCRPIVWFNLVISRDLRREPTFEQREPGSALRWSERLSTTRVGELLRYDWRPPLADALDGIARLAEVRRLVLLSGRPESSRRATERWLRRHEIRQYFSEVLLNDRGMSNLGFKLTQVRTRGVKEHVDDDGRVAYFLAQEKERTVYLISWLGNRWLRFPGGVRRVRSFREIARVIQQIDGSQAGGSTVDA